MSTVSSASVTETSSSKAMQPPGPEPCTFSPWGSLVPMPADGAHRADWGPRTVWGAKWSGCARMLLPWDGSLDFLHNSYLGSFPIPAPPLLSHRRSGRSLNLTSSSTLAHCPPGLLAALFQACAHISHLAPQPHPTSKLGLEAEVVSLGRKEVYQKNTGIKTKRHNEHKRLVRVG